MRFFCQTRYTNGRQENVTMKKEHDLSQCCKYFCFFKSHEILEFITNIEAYQCNSF